MQDSAPRPGDKVKVIGSGNEDFIGLVGTVHSVRKTDDGYHIIAGFTREQLGANFYRYLVDRKDGTVHYQFHQSEYELYGRVIM